VFQGFNREPCVNADALMRVRSASAAF